MVFTGEKPSVSMFVEHIVVPVPWHVVLEYAEAVGVDGADEHRTKAITKSRAHAFRHPTRDAFLQLGGGALSKREGDNRGRLGPFGDKRREPTGDGLRLSRTGTRDHLKVGASVIDDLLLLRREDDRLRHGVSSAQMIGGFWHRRQSWGYHNGER